MYYNRERERERERETWTDQISYHRTGQPGIATWGQVGWKILIVILVTNHFRLIVTLGYTDGYTNLMVTHYQVYSLDINIIFGS